MTHNSPHLFVDISSHGFGHLAQVAPILNELICQLPDLRLTIRSGLPLDKLRARIDFEFTYIEQRSDFGFVMLDAVSIDLKTTAQAYRTQHANWSQRVTAESQQLAALAPDLVLTDVAYLPLAGAARAGIAALSMCSLNWADLFAHFFAHENWATSIHQQILVAYNSAESFLRLTPAMPMSALLRQHAIAPVAALGQDRRAELRTRLACAPDEKLVLIAFGGFDKDLGAEYWPHNAGIRWLIPATWPIARVDMTALEPLGLPITDLLRSVDAVLTKPGYGTFTEAACNGTPVLYVRREDWPEQECLIDWLEINARCSEINESMLKTGNLHTALDALWQQPKPPIPRPEGAADAAARIAVRLKLAAYERWVDSGISYLVI